MMTIMSNMCIGLRRYNEKPAERHIPKCVNITAKPKPLVRNSGHSPVKYY